METWQTKKIVSEWLISERGWIHIGKSYTKLPYHLIRPSNKTFSEKGSFVPKKAIYELMD